MARLVLTTLGSLGDLHPMFPIARELNRRGHRVSFVVPELLQSSVVAEGFESHPVVLPKQPLSYDPDHTSPQDARSQIHTQYGPYLRLCVKVLDEASALADVILTTPHQVATAIVGQRRQIPWITLSVFPGFIPSGYTVPEPHWLPALPTPAGRMVNRLTWKVFRYGLRYLASETIHEVAGEDLAGARSLFSPGDLSPYLSLVLSSRFYSPPLPDWPRNVLVTGYPEYDRPRGWRPPPELERFLESGPPPVLVTGSSARNSGAFMLMAKEALEATGRRGILLTGRASDELLGKADFAILNSGVSAWRYLPLSELLPRAELVVHHAGIGTGLATIRRGLPAVAVPTTFDHWYNASRLRALGVAHVISGRQEFRKGVRSYVHLNAGSLAEAIEMVASEAGYRSRAAALAELMKSEDPVNNASDAIEDFLAGRGPSVSLPAALAPRRDAV